jgi:hypothetical protein
VASNALLANPQADNGFGDAIRTGYLVEEAARRGNTGGSVDRDRMKGRKMDDSHTLALQHSFFSCGERLVSMLCARRIVWLD